MITPKERYATLHNTADIMNISFRGENNSVYLARAVSTVPEDKREKLEIIFKEIVSAVKSSGLEAKLPVELGNISQNEINPQNHQLLLNSKVVLPLTYATSDGRGWEMGFSYGKKLIVPIIIPEQNINTPSLRLPFQIPVFYKDKKSLTNLLRELSKYDIGFGKLDKDPTVIGFREENPSVDLRKISQEYMEVLPWKMKN